MADIDTFQRLLRVNKHRLDDELEVQAEVMGQISDEIAAQGARLSEAENELKLVEARLYREFKDQDEKLTDKATDSAVKRHRERIKAFERVTSLAEILAQWNGLHEAWRSRGYSINKLCDLYIAQYFTKDSHSISNRSDRRRGEEVALSERRPYDRSSTRRRISEG